MKALKLSGILLVTLLIPAFVWNPTVLPPPASAPESPLVIAATLSNMPVLLEASTAGTKTDLPPLSGVTVTSSGSLADTKTTQSGTVDLAVQDFSLTQGVPDEPLVIGKLTAALVKVSLPEDVNVDALVRVGVNRKTFERTVNLVGPQATVTMQVDEPSAVEPITAKVAISPTGQVTDPNPADNTKTVTYQTVQTTEKVVVFFLPVDWTSEEQSKYHFDTAFKNFVEDNQDFFAGTYPLAKNQLAMDFTTTPHMLTAFEKILADNQGQLNYRNALALYGSVSIAGRRYRPDATIIVAILPPGWFSKHGQPKTLGLTLSEVKGTVTAQFAATDTTTSAHEVGHLYWLYEDYDFAIKPPRPGVEILVPNYWVQRDRELVGTSAKKLWTFLSSGDTRVTYWVDQRIYEYLMAKFAMNGGTASAPSILAATMAWEVGQDGAPAEMSANIHRFEPTQPIYCSVAGIALKAGSTLEAKLYHGNTLVRTVGSQTTVAGNKWYQFLIAERELAEDKYRVDIYLDGQSVKSNEFEVKASK